MGNKLELYWIGKEEKLQIEPRILIEKTELGFSQLPPVVLLQENEPTFDNLLIHGDNLLALKALEAKYSGKIKCIYIDPPYNTGYAFSTYDDNLEHSTWLSLMRPRLEILKKLLTEDGSIWISIDDDEQAYLKVLCDEIFGRNNFINTIIWQKIHSTKNDAKYLSENHDFILCYAKNKEKVQFNLLDRTEEMNARYKNPDNDPRGPWQSGDLVANQERTTGHYIVTSPTTGKQFDVPQGKHWVYSQENLEEMIRDNRIWFGKDGNSFPRKKRFLSEVMGGKKADTIWMSDEVGHNQEAKREIIALNLSSVPFDTPKPERLIQRVLTIATNPGDLVLDSFLGSGTTAAVAQKMGRAWIGIEMTDVAYSMDKPRMDLVISGKDKGGITKATNYKGGGSYKFYEIAPTLINVDDFGQEIINPQYSPQMLAASIALHEGYTFDPNPDKYWKQANNGGTGYLFVTTNHVSAELISSINAELGDEEFLLVVCKSYDELARNISKRIAIKKIPQSLLKTCQFGVDDYSLNIICPPTYEDEEDE